MQTKQLHERSKNSQTYYIIPQSWNGHISFPFCKHVALFKNMRFMSSGSNNFRILDAFGGACLCTQKNNHADAI